MAAAATPRPGRPSSPRTWGMRRCPRRRWPPMRCSASASRAAASVAPPRTCSAMPDDVSTAAFAPMTCPTPPTMTLTNRIHRG